MTTIKKEFIEQKKSFSYVCNKVEEGCKLFNEDMTTEAGIAFAEAMQYSEELVEEHPGEAPYLVTLAETYHLVALGYSYIEESEKARSLIKKALSIYKNIHDMGHAYEPILASSSAQIEKAAGNDSKAIKILEKIIKGFDSKTFIEPDEDKDFYCTNLLFLAKLYFEDDQYENAVKAIRQLSELKKRYSTNSLNSKSQDYIDLLNIASFQSMEHEDQNFHRFVLEEGLEACRQADASGQKVNLLCYGTFFQDMLKLLFFNDESEKLRKLYQELIAFCDQHLEKEPRLLKYKISGQLNYAVFCAKNGNSEEAEEIVCEAISGCSEMEDTDAPELTLFMVSALNILSNLQWEKGETKGALRDLGSECKILNDFLDNHPELSSSMLPLLIDLKINQSRLLHEIGQNEQAEQIIESIKTSHKPQDEEVPQPSLACYLMVVKKIADYHWTNRDYESAKKEYQEAMYYLKTLKSNLPEIADTIKEVEEEIQDRVLVINNL